MDKKELEARLANLDQALAQSMANHNALLGSKQECLFWLQQLAIKDAAECKDDAALKAMVGASEVVDLDGQKEHEPEQQPHELYSGQGGC